MGKSSRNPKDESEEEYYEDEGEFQDGEEEGLDLPTEEQRRNRLIAVFSTSYGISIAVHLAIILIMATIVIATQEQEAEAVVIAKNEFKPPTYDEKLKRDLKKNPKIKAENPVEKPIIVREQEVEITTDVPKGTDMNNQSNKNLDSTSVNDAYGAGGGAAGAYGNRFGKGSLRNEGGSEGTESAVTAALRWLMFHQSPDGSWSSNGWTRNCGNNPNHRGTTCKPHPMNAGATDYDEGVTALALLAFLGNGHTHKFGQFKLTVSKGLRWLKKQQQSNGAIGYRANHGETIYNHAISTMAICEAYYITKDPMLKENAQNAIDYCVKSRNPSAGWKYGYRSGKNDTSVTGWMVLALKAGKLAGVDVPADAFEGARKWFERATDNAGNVGYQGPGEGSAVLEANKNKFDEVPCMTAVSVICRIFTGEPRSVEAIRKGAGILMANKPAWSKGGSTRKCNFYYWYYATYAMFQFGGPKWLEWNKAMQSSLCPTQEMGGCEDGSWEPVGEWCLAGGRVYATAINALTLEIYYRYERAQGE